MYVINSWGYYFLCPGPINESQILIFVSLKTLLSQSILTPRFLISLIQPCAFQVAEYGGILMMGAIITQLFKSDCM